MTKIQRYSIDGLVPNSDFQKIELPKWIDKILDKEHVNYINITSSQLEIAFNDEGFLIGASDIKAITRRGWDFDTINTYGTSGIMLVFTKTHKN